MAMCLGYLTGCSVLTQDAQVTNEEGPVQAQPDIPPRFAALMREPRPMLQIGIVRTGVQSRLIQETIDGPFVRYLSIDRAALVMENGLLHSMFSFGEGLMGVDQSQTLALLQRGTSGQTERRHTYLDGQDRTDVRVFQCQLTDRGPSTVDLATGVIAVRLMHESCRENGPETVFDNQYWVDLRTGEVVQSLQWAGENFGSLSTRVIPLP